MNAKKWLIRGAAVAGGFLAGAQAEAMARHYLPDPNEELTDETVRDIWEGKSYEWSYPLNTADDIADTVDYEAKQGWWLDHPTYQDDLKTIRMKFTHAISDAHSKGHENVTVELSDRERLVLYHVAPDAAHAAVNDPIREGFLEE